ncbi:MAG: chemotaxis protein CheA [Spirochaetes bacterium]|nr:chemotaxis protein CheA [Spirochaetota bacterium]
MVYIDEKRIQKAFLEEVSELLESLNEKLLELEQSPEDKAVINEIFRLTHSIKSEAALVGFKNMSTIAHKMEDIFERVRRGALLVDKSIIDSLLAAYDRIMQLIAAVQNDQSEADFEISDVINPLLDILKEKPAEKKKEEPEKKKSSEDVKKDAGADEKFATDLKILEGVLESLGGIKFSETEQNQIEEGMERGEAFYKIAFHLEDECDMRYPRAYLVYNNFVNNGLVVKTIPDVQQETDDEKFGYVELFLLTNSSKQVLIECAEVDQVDRVEIFTIDKKIVSSEFGLNTDIDSGISAEDLQEAERLEKEWMSQLENEQKEGQKAVKQEAKVENNLKSDSVKKETTDEGDKIITDADKENIDRDLKKDDKKNISTQPIKEAQKQTIRVDIERLDTLMNLVGELIINRSRFIQIHDKISDQIDIQEVRTELEDATNELDRIADLMQMGMMQARMVPIGNVFSKFPRLVRDLANQLHKVVDLEIIGENTEIDRTVIELIADPLTHLIRNSVDHGLETPEERENNGKSRQGKVTLKSYQEGSSIYIEVSDDGKGINVEAIKEKVLEKGLATPQQLQSLPIPEILNFIFEPGFSTKKEITSTSGRGVGMDVVKTQIEKLRGRVDIHTVVGSGTKFIIVLPLTLTIVEALLVNVQRNIFAVPISVVEETIKINRNEIKDFDDYQIYNLRNETLAIIYLSDLVGLEREQEEEELYIVVVSFERRKIGLVVNNLIGEQDIVIKALDEVLKNNEGIAGATVLGDGKIALILDTSTLVKTALREINKLAEKYDFYSDDNVSYGLNQLYDVYNKDEKGNMIVKKPNTGKKSENIVETTEIATEPS